MGTANKQPSTVNSAASSPGLQRIYSLLGGDDDRDKGGAAACWPPAD
jgi:hypothetical protein